MNKRWQASADQKIWQDVLENYSHDTAFKLALSGALDHLEPSQDGKRHLYVRQVIQEAEGRPEMIGDSFILTLEKGV